MHRERVENLRRVAAELPDDRLDMRRWTNTHHRCGTAHCLGGWFALDRWAQSNTPILEIFDVRDDGVVDGGWVDLRQLIDFFGIKETHVVRLFYPHDEEDMIGGWPLLTADFIITKPMLLRNLDHLLAGEPLEQYQNMTDLLPAETA